MSKSHGFHHVTGWSGSLEKDCGPDWQVPPSTSMQWLVKFGPTFGLNTKKFVQTLSCSACQTSTVPRPLHLWSMVTKAGHWSATGSWLQAYSHAWGLGLIPSTFVDGMMEGGTWKSTIRVIPSPIALWLQLCQKLCMRATRLSSTRWWISWHCHWEAFCWRVLWIRWLVTHLG